MDINIQSEQSIINSIVHSQFRLTLAFATIFDAFLDTFAYILSTFPYFVSFAISRTVSKVREEDVLVRSSTDLKSFLNGRFSFLISYFHFSHTHTHKFRFQLRDIFLHCLSPFSGFYFQLNPHSENPFLILGNTRFHIQFYI